MKRQIHVVDLDELVSESVYLKIMFANIWLMIDYIFWKLYMRIAYVFMLLINFFFLFFLFGIRRISQPLLLNWF